MYRLTIIGWIILLGLMALGIYNDINRIRRIGLWIEEILLRRNLDRVIWNIERARVSVSVTICKDCA